MKHRASYNSILLAGARLFSTASSLLITMILTKTLDLSANGTYAQCLVIISVGLSIISLGLMEGSNYFFAKSKDKKEKQEYVSAILFLVYVSGLALAIILLLFRKSISNYFSNPTLSTLIFLIALHPMLANLINVLNVLYIATDRAKTVVFRNAAISLIHLLIVSITACTTKDVGMILLLYLLAEIVTDIFMLRSFSRAGYSVRLHLPSRTILQRILQYCLPMAAYIAMNAFLRDTDKLIIGWYETTEMQAVYSNCAKILPLDIISAAFYTILVPQITQHIVHHRLDTARKIFANYLKVGLLSTATFALAILLCPEETILFLYSADYLQGITVFILYNFVEFIKFANVTIVISAAGKTKILMIVSATALIANLVLSLVLYSWLGFVGPAVGTVIVTALTVATLLILSANVLKTNIIHLLDWKFLGIYAVKTTIAICVCLLVKKALVQAGVLDWMILFAIIGLFCLIVLLSNLKQIKNTLSQIDRSREEQL